MKHLRRRMRAFYRTRPRARGEMSAIGKLTEGMLGQMATPRLKAKAAETRNLCPLLPQLCAEHPAILAELGIRALHLRVCCTEINSFYDILNTEPRRMTPDGLHRLETCVCRFLTHWRAFAGHCVYKHHMFFHLAERAREHGNPKWYWTYADETENRLMKQVAQSLHGGPTFYSSFLQKVLPEAVA